MASIIIHPNNPNYYNEVLRQTLNAVGLDHRYTDRVNYPENTLYVTHDIISIETERLFWLIPYTKQTQVAKITSESPRTHQLYIKGFGLLSDGLKILLNPNCPKDLENKIRQAALSLEKILNEEVIVTRPGDNIQKL